MRVFHCDFEYLQARCGFSAKVPIIAVHIGYIGLLFGVFREGPSTVVSCHCGRSYFTVKSKPPRGGEGEFSVSADHG